MKTLREDFEADMDKHEGKEIPAKRYIPLILTHLLYCNYAILDTLESIQKANFLMDEHTLKNEMGRVNMSQVVTAVSHAATKIISEKLRQARINQNMTMNQLAAMCGLVNRQSIEMMESQRAGSRLSLGLLFTICVVLKLEPRDLIPMVVEVVDKAKVKTKTISTEILFCDNEA